MGLIRAAMASAGGVMADQWKEFFYCESMGSDILMKKGQKQVTKRSQNKGEDNIITNGSKIAVADGQCMIIVDQGKVVDLSAEPGEYIYDTSSEPTIFTGDLADSVGNVFKNMLGRLEYGGATGKDQRVYYINIKEITDNKFGTINPVPFRIVDKNIGLDIDLSVRCNGSYSYRIENPLLFYTNVAGNVSSTYDRENLDQTLKSEFLSALQPAFAKLSALGIRYSELPGHTLELADAMNNILSEKWGNLRGIKVVSVGINSVSAPKEDEDMIKDLQKTAVMRNASMGAAALTAAQAEAMKNAAKNPNGAFTGFMGMNMAQNSGGINAGELYKMGEEQKMTENKPKIHWVCPECKFENDGGKFCSNCGAKKPDNDTWFCSNCGTQNTGKFCSNCGTKRP